MEFFINYLISIISNPHFLLAVVLISYIGKLYLLLMLGLRGLRSSKIPKPLFYLLGILVGGLIVDFSWVIKLIREIHFHAVDYRVILFFIRLSWASNLIQFQFLGLFIESLGEKYFSIRNHQKFLLFLNSLFISYFLYVALIHFNITIHRTWLEFIMMSFCSLYMLPILVFPGLYFTIKRIRVRNFPKILKKQLTILIKYLICPYLFTEFVQGFFCVYSKQHVYAINSLSIPLLTFALFYCTRKIIGLRFLNFQSHVQSHHIFNFIDDFKNVLEQLSHVTSTKELGHITQMFFKDAFNIVPSRMSLHLRNIDARQAYESEHELSFTESIVENVINRHSNVSYRIAEYMYQVKIFIKDEIAFSNFYEENKLRKDVLQFLEQINADIFLPIYEHEVLVAYIIIEQDARVNEFFSNIERDEMVVFASYLGNIINLLQNRNLDALVQKEKEMREELYHKHQEINQYKESIRSFLHENRERKIGILFYKNRRFIFGNQAAKELIGININTQAGHPLVKALKHIAQQVEDYKSSQITFAKDEYGKVLVLAALPNLEQNNIIITVYYPEIADIIKKQIDQLKNPSEWDYLLYLETTESGKLIDQLIPGSTGTLFNFKIELLKIALSKKALLLQMPQQDLLPTVEILHHISLRETLHVLKLNSPCKNFDTAITLFGINPIFGVNQEIPLLERLNNTGTLFIENIHHLDLETQNYLAEFIKYGYYHVFKSDQKVSSNVRIVCSTNQNLQTLMQEGRFSKELFHELKQTTVSMPSLMSLSEQELYELAQGFTEQAIKSPEFKNLLELTDREKQKLVNVCPVSLHEFKAKVQQLLVNKSKKNQIYQETQFDPAYNISDPELVEAARLGKKALKDPKMLALLWNKFKNQNKIAQFLGVNRSSVNRRCKEYNLG